MQSPLPGLSGFCGGDHDYAGKDYEDDDDYASKDEDEDEDDDQNGEENFTVEKSSPADPLLHQVAALHVQVEHSVLSLHLRRSF